MSVLARVNSERLVVLSWPRAILLQLAHPAVAAGVLGHSTFRGSVTQAAARLHQTVRAMLGITFGSAETRAAVIRRIKSIHDGVNGPGYSANDPALLLWVHATLLQSTAELYARVVAPLNDAELDALCAESGTLLEALGGTPELTPRTWWALTDYMEHMRASGTLTVSDEVRRLGHAVMAPRAAGVILPLGRAHALFTAGLLPPWLRDAYGVTWNAGQERRFLGLLRLLRVTRRATPAALALWPASRAKAPGA